MALIGENLEQDNYNSSKLLSGGHSGSVTRVGSSKVIRDDLDKVQDHIKNIIKGSNEKNTFIGLEKLKKAADEKVLREGQIIFGTVSLSHHEDVDDTFQGWIYNLLAPFFLTLNTGQMRSFAYFHASVYAGEYDGEHYVIENGGGDEVTRLGKISALTIDDAFEKESNFFVVSPPKDSSKKSTRYLVLQRALACLGVPYVYSMRAVNCETFVTALFGAMGAKNFESIQMEVIKPKKGKQKTIVNTQQSIERFEKFHQDLTKRIQSVPKEGLLLTLSYYLKMQDVALTPWFSLMINDYEQLFKTAARGETQLCLLLLKQGLNPNTVLGGCTALEKAIMAGHSDTALALINAGADGTNALVASAQHGLTNAVRPLVLSGHAKIDHQDSDGCTALIRAAQNGFLDTVSALILAHSEVEIEDKYKDTALIKAAQKNHLEIVKELIKTGANIEHKNITGYTALSMASRYGHSDSVRALIIALANIDHQDMDGNTALILASQNGHIQTVCDLIKAKANIDHGNTYGTTALMMAAENGSSAIVTELLAAGADIYKQDQYGSTAKTLAEMNNHPSLVNVIETARATGAHQEEYF